MPSRVLATVRSCMNGRRLRSCLFICHKVSRQFSFIISRRQFRISSSTRTLFRPPRGLSWILSSRMYLPTTDLAVDLFTPSVSATNRLSSASSSEARIILWRCSKGILFLGGISTVVLKISIHLHVSALAKRNRWFSRYVIAAMLVDKNNRFFISSFCSSTSICTFHHCYLYL